MVTKASDTRLSPANAFIYSKLQKLYAEDLSSRMLGMFTFADSTVPPGLNALKAAGIHPAQWFKFNNSAMFSSNLDDPTMMPYYRMGTESFHQFIDYIKKENAVPISLNSTH